MKPANLLINPESLRFAAEKDLSSEINTAVEAYEKARGNRDKIFNSPEFWQIQIDGNLLIEIISDFSMAKLFFPWFKSAHRELILKWLHLRTSPKNAKDFEELEAEFPDENNGDFAFGDNGNDKCVFDINSWYKLHADFLTAFPKYIDWDVNEVLPLAEYSNLKIKEVVESETGESWNLEDAVEHFGTDLVQIFRDNKAALVELASEIAQRNCYIENKDLSGKEKQLSGGKFRLIFEIIKNKKMQYLSLDFENGQFEVCNDSGTHIGVWNFSGKKTDTDKDSKGKNKDDKGRHNLKSLKKQ